MVISGPRPQASRNLVAESGAAACSPARAGIESLDSPTGSWTSCPESGCGVVAYCTTGKLMVIRLVVSGGTISVRPSRPTLAKRVPFGLMILMASGAAAKPDTGKMTISRIVRRPRQLSRSTGFGPPAIQAPPTPGRNRLAAARPGSEPRVELADTSSERRPVGRNWPRIASSAGPGTASAAADSLNEANPGRLNVRANGG